MENSDRGIAPELRNHNVDRSIAGLLASDQVQREPTVNAGYSVVDAMVPSQGTNAAGSKVFPTDISLPGWTTPWEVQKNNGDNARASKCCAFGMIRAQDCVWIDF